MNMCTVLRDCSAFVLFFVYKYSILDIDVLLILKLQMGIKILNEDFFYSLL